MKINVSRICLKRVTGMKTFRMRMKIKVENNESTCLGFVQKASQK